jgi:hypothetical protein
MFLTFFDADLALRDFSGRSANRAQFAMSFVSKKLLRER